MNALQQPRPPLETVEQHRHREAPKRKTRQRSRLRPYQGMAIENTAKLVVNVVLVAGALSALVKLLPYNISQQAKLREISTEVESTQTRVNSLQTDLNRSFDPQQANKIMQEQSSRVDPMQRPIFLLKSK
jgi:outer membrane murein-binding lipoprotein Lpp